MPLAYPSAGGAKLRAGSAAAEDLRLGGRELGVGERTVSVEAGQLLELVQGARAVRGRRGRTEGPRRADDDRRAAGRPRRAERVRLDGRRRSDADLAVVPAPS